MSFARLTRPRQMHILIVRIEQQSAINETVRRDSQCPQIRQRNQQRLQRDNHNYCAFFEMEGKVRKHVFILVEANAMRFVCIANSNLTRARFQGYFERSKRIFCLSGSTVQNSER